MKPHVSVITLGVRDLNRSKRFYHEGLGWPIEQEYPEWVTFNLAGGKIVRPGQNPQWGGRFGYFSDPDGYLWKVASGAGQQWLAE